uniref:Uncharacterized protein n=1 Tax=Arundo donax TaxID=35708 RepID=A0A0A9BM63_ARUDO
MAASAWERAATVPWESVRMEVPKRVPPATDFVRMAASVGGGGGEWHGSGDRGS